MRALADAKVDPPKRSVYYPVNHPLARLTRSCDTESYYNIDRLINYPPEDHSLQGQRELDTIQIRKYSTYLNKKGKCKDQVRISWIDKKSDNYIPFSTPKVNHGASYCFKVIDSTVINHIIGTAGFSVIEYFGHFKLEEETDNQSTEPAILSVLGVRNNTSNIVQVVHGVYFTRDRQILSRHLYGRKQELVDYIPLYSRAYYDHVGTSLNHLGPWKTMEISANNSFQVV